MKRENIIVYVSSRNNYDMLEGEVLNNIDTEGFEFINVDDNSCDEELEKGKAICKKHDIVFLENKDRGVQMATQTLIDFINENRPQCKWIVCFQHDIYPISKNFFDKLDNYIKSAKLNDFGIIGFNVLDHGDYTLNSYDLFQQGNSPLGMIGMCHLSVQDQSRRWLCTKQQTELLKQDIWKTPFIVEFPMWAVVGINVNNWNEYIIPTNQYHFHLWLPDIAMQFNYKNKACLILPDLYCLNNQSLKEKYDINKNSAQGAMRGNDYHFGEYSNFVAWKERWGWHYENVHENFKEIQDHYTNTLISEFFNHDINNGPLRSFNI
jgi:hypothetical protein